MPLLQVRDFPTGLYERLRRCAESNHCSIAQQTIIAIESYLDSRTQEMSVGASCQLNDEASYLYSQCSFNTVDSAVRNECSARAMRHRLILANLDEIGGFALPDGYLHIEELVKDAKDER